ncbi:helix-turn-helix domain-containing protein [Paenibacillus melissococcoides]|uniref:Helix-turn-helix domain-containing protein n=1 Tax=Paenibacillus melissococcoides TaxID=2912268 RepID=A0ABN8U8P3_9BACL|nr:MULTISPECIES: helix-turn-helix transcriptional regulator [Paenibacillus]MEB9893223.1 helix-turn-helix transcriptional regulator [Bacillus cereus]MBG9795276.1 XRE family transcriptional regulator [Paenibacillus dendritiformis]MDU5145391.1 helix-turn-helix transcriptional regulator [Paenibacillus dendritiformis]CAH8246106.1 helix-turn-helix domain-containing protein [Paenibacillus melissococcoides]CAH8712990.1 helix-turn-helix domain-containing protein [Paenibacillus melissococcoides]
MTGKNREVMGSRIKQLRLKHGLSQDDVAHALGMKRANVANYEAGRTTPPSDIIGRLADMLHTSADYLLGRTDNPLALHAAGTIPEWATAKDKRDFRKMLEEDPEVMFDGVPMDEDDRERVIQVLEALFWDAKKRNKRKPKRTE